jgi:hypothetical protein
MFNLSLTQAIVHTRFKETTIVPVLKKNKVTCPNVYRHLGLETILCIRILDFLTGRPQAVRIGNSTSFTLTLMPGVCPQSPAVLPVHPRLHAQHQIHHQNNTRVVGLITNNDKSAYREEVSELALWCHDNNLSLHVS